MLKICLLCYLVAYQEEVIELTAERRLRELQAQVTTHILAKRGPGRG